MQTPLIQKYPPDFGGPHGKLIQLIQPAQAVPVYEGPWVRIDGAKSASLELAGSISTLSLQLYGTNNPNPVNAYTITVGGTITANDTVNAVFTNPNLPGNNTETATYTVLNTDTTTTIAAGLAAAISADTNLDGIGITASSSGAVVTVNFPSVWPGGGTSGGIPQGIANFTGLTTSVTGSATETAAVATTTTGETVGAALTALGLTAVAAPLPLFIKARLATLTGGGANVTASLNVAV